MPGKYTAWGNAYDWPPTDKLNFQSMADMSEYIADMVAEFEMRQDQINLAHRSATLASMASFPAAPLPAVSHPASLQSGGQPVHSVHQVAPPAYPAGQAQMNAAPYAASLQSGRQQMLPSQQVVGSAMNSNQMNWNQGYQAGPTYLIAGNQFLMPQAAPLAPHASQANRMPATYAAVPAPFGQNMYAARHAAPPAPAPQAYHHHHAPSAALAGLLPQSQSAAPQQPIDLTGVDDEITTSTPAPQRAGTKRAKSDNSSGAAPPKVKKARVEKPKVEKPKVEKPKVEKPKVEKKPKKEKKVKTPKIPNSGLRTPTLAAATTAPGYDNSFQFEGEPLAMQQQPQYQQYQQPAQQQQQKYLSAPVETQSSSNPINLISDAPEMMRTDSAISGLDGEQEQQQQQQQGELEAVVENQLSSNADDFTFFDLDGGQEQQQQQQQEELEAAVVKQFSSNADDSTFDFQYEEYVPSESAKGFAAAYRAGTMQDYEINLMDTLEPGWRTCI
jgi:hypothetical protein